MLSRAELERRGGKTWSSASGEIALCQRRVDMAVHLYGDRRISREYARVEEKKGRSSTGRRARRKASAGAGAVDVHRGGQPHLD